MNKRFNYMKCNYKICCNPLRYLKPGSLLQLEKDHGKSMDRYTRAMLEDAFAAINQLAP